MTKNIQSSIDHFHLSVISWIDSSVPRCLLLLHLPFQQIRYGYDGVMLFLFAAFPCLNMCINTHMLSPKYCSTHSPHLDLYGHFHQYRHYQPRNQLLKSQQQFLRPQPQLLLQRYVPFMQVLETDVICHFISVQIVKLMRALHLYIYTSHSHHQLPGPLCSQLQFQRCVSNFSTTILM